MTSQPLEMFRFGMFLSACLLISFVAQSVGLVVGAAMNVQVSNKSKMVIVIELKLIIVFLFRTECS
jgi:hypothetical protein